MIKGDYDELCQIAKTHFCAYHQKPVVVAWYPEESVYVLRCGDNHYPEEVTRQPSLTELHKQGVELPEPIKSNVEKGIRRRSMQQGKQPTAVTFYGVPATDLGTGELIPRERLEALVAYARRYKLDPARGHVCLMYSKLYITIDGYLFYAKQSGIPFTLDSRPLKEDEYKEYKAPENAHVWLARVKLTETGGMFLGFGVVTKEDIEAKSEHRPEQLRSPVVAKHPWQMAQKRAEWQALRRAFPIGETTEQEKEG